MLPLLQHRYSISTDPAKLAFGGGSFAGVSALYAAMHYPHVFGSVLAESPSLWVADGRFLGDLEDHKWVALRRVAWLVLGQARGGGAFAFAWRHAFDRGCAALGAPCITSRAAVGGRAPVAHSAVLASRTRSLRTSSAQLSPSASLLLLWGVRAMHVCDCIHKR